MPYTSLRHVRSWILCGLAVAMLASVGCKSSGSTSSWHMPNPFAKKPAEGPEKEPKRNIPSAHPDRAPLEPSSGGAD